MASVNEFDGVLAKSNYTSSQIFLDEIALVSSDPSFQNESDLFDAILNIPSHESTLQEDAIVASNYGAPTPDLTLLLEDEDPLSKIITASGIPTIPQNWLDTLASSDGEITTSVCNSHQTLDNANPDHYLNSLHKVAHDSPKPEEINYVNAVEQQKEYLATNLAQVSINNRIDEIKIIKNNEQNQKNPSLGPRKIHFSLASQGAQCLNHEASPSYNVQAQPTTRVCSPIYASSSAVASIFSHESATSDSKREKNRKKCKQFRKCKNQEIKDKAHLVTELEIKNKYLKLEKESLTKRVKIMKDFYINAIKTKKVVWN